MPFININNANFYYELHGKGSPLILISGLKGEHNGWLSVLEELAKSHQVLIFDNRGVGKTTDCASTFDVEKMADDTMAIAHALGLKKPRVIGHSLGGAVAQVIGKKYASDITSIAICNSFIKLNESAKNAFMKTMTAHETGASPAEIMDTLIPWAFSRKFLTPEVIEIIRKASNDNPFPQSSDGFKRQMKALCDFDSRKWIDSITVPTLVIGSDEDLIASVDESREIADLIRQSKLVILPTAHASQVEAPELFIKAINNFHCV